MARGLVVTDTWPHLNSAQRNRKTSFWHQQFNSQLFIIIINMPPSSYFQCHVITLIPVICRTCLVVHATLPWLHWMTVCDFLVFSCMTGFMNEVQCECKGPPHIWKWRFPTFISCSIFDFANLLMIAIDCHLHKAVTFEGIHIVFCYHLYQCNSKGTVLCVEADQTAPVWICSERCCMLFTVSPCNLVNSNAFSMVKVWQPQEGFVLLHRLWTKHPYWRSCTVLLDCPAGDQACYPILDTWRRS